MSEENEKLFEEIVAIMADDKEVDLWENLANTSNPEEMDSSIL